MNRNQARRAFTLVELLVVIGIIAVLISILLPSLMRAREQANLIRCEANLRQVGQLFQLYAAENNGYFPYGKGRITPNLEWFWTDTLTLLNTKKNLGQTVTDPTAAKDLSMQCIEPSGVLIDTDLPPQGFAPKSGDPAAYSQEDYRGTGCYTANLRVLADAEDVDPIGETTDIGQNDLGPATPIAKNEYFPLRPISSIKRPSEVMYVWCSAVDISIHAIDPSGNVAMIGADPLCWQLDCSLWQYGYGMCYPIPADHSRSYPAAYNNVIALGNTGVSSVGVGVWSSEQPLANPSRLPLAFREENVDDTSTTYDYYCEMRFRHMNNTEMNGLYVDGHVETSKIGTVVARDIACNPLLPLAGPPQ